MRFLSFTLTMGLTLLLTACVGMNPKRFNCSRIHWQQIGLEEGQHGRFNKNLADMFPQCSNKIVIDRPAYQRGWDQGIIQYCQPQNAYRLGVEGKKHPNLCPPKLKPPVDEAYRRGAEQYKHAAIIQSKLDGVTAELTEVEKKRAKQKQLLKILKHVYSSQAFSPQQQYRIRKLSLQVDQLSKKENTLKNDKAHLNAQYNSLLQYKG